MKTIPTTSSELIALLDLQEKVDVIDIHSVLTEEARLNLARQLGRRELVTELKNLLKRKD